MKRLPTLRSTQLGKSQKAGAIGVGVSIVGRIVTAAPPMLLPQFGVEVLTRHSPLGVVLRRSPLLSTGVYMGMLGCTIQATTPWMLGALPQVWEGDAGSLGVGDRGTKAYWNRGM